MIKTNVAIHSKKSIEYLSELITFLDINLDSTNLYMVVTLFSYIKLH